MSNENQETLQQAILLDLLTLLAGLLFQNAFAFASMMHAAKAENGSRPLANALIVEVRSPGAAHLLFRDLGLGVVDDKNRVAWFDDPAGATLIARFSNYGPSAQARLQVRKSDPSDQQKLVVWLRTINEAQLGSPDYRAGLEDKIEVRIFPAAEGSKDVDDRRPWRCLSRDTGYCVEVPLDSLPTPEEH